MSAPICESKAQCQINGLAGTAVVVSLVEMAYLVFDVLSAGLGLAGLGTVLWLLVVPMGPTLLSVGYAGLMRLWQQPFGWIGFAITLGGAVWGVFFLNMLVRL